MKADVWQDSSDSSSVFIAMGSHWHNPGNSACSEPYTKQIFILSQIRKAELHWNDYNLSLFHTSICIFHIFSLSTITCLQDHKFLLRWATCIYSKGSWLNYSVVTQLFRWCLINRRIRSGYSIPCSGSAKSKTTLNFSVRGTCVLRWISKTVLWTE